MGRFVRVEAAAAGPAALGLLVPPGRRTFVILRPRSLAVDLVLCRSAEDDSPVQLSSAEAQAAVQAVYRHLDRGEGVEGVMVGSGMRVRVGAWVFAVCLRREGQAYASFVGEADDREELWRELRGILVPEGGREAYFNTRFFMA